MVVSSIISRSSSNCLKMISKKFTIGGVNQINLVQQVMNEVKVLKSLKHPCIIKIEDVVDTPDILFIVLELVDGGELFDKVVSIGQYDEPTAKLISYQMVCSEGEKNRLKDLN
ncbi:ovarian-specific serine/threonine-protein kinase Lok-like [Crassostrea virginica]